MKASSRKRREGKRGSGTRDLIQEFLGSTHIFSATVAKIVEEQLLKEITGGRLTFPQFKLLRLVAMADAHSVTDVAAFLGVSKAAASKAVDKLVRRRFLHRAEGKTDRRAIHLTLAPQGRRVVEAYDEARNGKLATLFGRFPAKDLIRTAGLLDRISSSLVEDSALSDEVCLQCGIYFREKCLVRQITGRNCFYVRRKIGTGARSHE